MKEIFLPFKLILTSAAIAKNSRYLYTAGLSTKYLEVLVIAMLMVPNRIVALYEFFPHLIGEVLVSLNLSVPFPLAPFEKGALKKK
jgi:hypothetical protein